MIDATPSAESLIQSVRTFLNGEVLPSVDDAALAYNLRIANNLLAIVERELNQGNQASKEEIEVLNNLGIAGGSLLEMRQRMSDKIRQGACDENINDLAKHLLSPSLARLGIDNPSYSSYKQLAADKGK